jgi:hypothetical protein
LRLGDVRAAVARVVDAITVLVVPDRYARPGVIADLVEIEAAAGADNDEGPPSAHASC